jgi:exonuclease III
MKNLYSKRNLKISFWNINGFMCKSVNKFTDNDFIEKIVGYDIFCLQETHCDLDQCLELQEYSRPVHLIRSKLKQTGKRYGGMSVYVRNSVRPGIKFLNHASDDFIWLILSKDIFGLHQDVYLCFIYDPPE